MNDSNSIAIIGMACRYPGARSYRQFWDNLIAGVESISTFTPEEIEFSDPGAGESYVRARSVLEDADLFDAGFFGISPREAQLMDPQHRVFLELCWSALEDAGIDPSRYPGLIGVFAGCGLNSYLLRQVCTTRDSVAQLTGEYPVGQFPVFLGNEKDFLATRAAYKFNLRGPAMTIQAACATGLVAVAQACQNLLTYSCDTALAGAVTITFPQKRGYQYEEGGMASRDGHCRAFDAAAAGTVFGDGAGIVVLKRLEDALADGDSISAVIRGFALNNDGSGKAGYTAPSIEGQAQVIAQALAMAGFSADTVSYIEAHGTGTPLGDPVEIAALTRAFRESTVRTGFCAIGTAKSNIGHTEHASGVAGLIKTALALRHRKLPASLHFEKPNTRIHFEETPFFVNARTADWEADGPLRAGVSAFGVGGTNAHLVLEEAPAHTAEPTRRKNHLFCFSARSDASLQSSLNRFAQYARDSGDFSLADAAYTLHSGRKSFPERAIVVSSDPADLASMLESGDSMRLLHRSAPLGKPTPVFLFPGQGAQYPGMGQSLYRVEPEFRRQLDTCAEILQPHLGLDIRDILYPAASNQTAAADQIRHTCFAQPALFVTAYSAASLFRHYGIEPEVLIGHSIGEFVAACLAGVLTLEDALRLIAARGRLMGSLPPGGMLSVRLSEQELTPRLSDDLSIAAVNSPKLVVAAGPKESLARLETELAREGVQTRLLHTSHAFHSAMMDPILDEFRREVASVSLRAPQIRILSTVTGQYLTEDQAVDPEYWSTHLRRTVRFGEAAANACACLQEPVLVECGPGIGLTTLVRQAKGGSGVSVFPSMSSPGQNETEVPFLEALGRFWLNGLEPDWSRLYAGERRRRIPLPTYSFERARHWMEPAEPVGRIDFPLQPQGQTEVFTTMSNEIPKMERAPRSERIQKDLAALLEELSGMPAAEIIPHVPWVELGFDSLFLTQFTQSLRRKLNVKVAFRQLLDEQGTLASLTSFVDTQLPTDFYPPDAPTPTSAPGVPATAPQQPATIVPHQAGAVSFPSVLPAAPGENGSAVDRLFHEQLQVMSQLMREQLAAVSGRPVSLLAPAPIAPLTAPAQIAAPSVPTMTPAPEPRVAGAEPKPTSFTRHGPFKPVQAGAVGGLTLRQEHYIQRLTERYNQRTAGSKRLTQAHRAHLADPRVVSGFRAQWKELVYPLVTKRSSGSRLWDIDGNEYIDIVNGFGAILLGHSPEFVREAVKRQIDAGVEIGPLSPLAGEVAKMISELTGMERVAFCNTGSEAVMAALRVSRTATARDKFVSFSGSYHGTFDEVLVRKSPRPGTTGSAPIAPGIPVDNLGSVYVLDYGSDQALEFIEKHGDELAAVLVEPVQSRNPELQPREFLHKLRRLTEASGTALIFDEVVTGFRCALGGAQQHFGIRADLATYGKVLGGGYPFGIVSGKAEYLDALDGGFWQYGDASIPERGMTFFAGTFIRHPLALAAAHAVLTHLKQQGPGLQEGLNRKAAGLAADLDALFRANGVPAHMQNFASWFFFHFPPEARFSGLFYTQMREKGIHIHEAYPCFLTTAHSDADIQRIRTAFAETIAEMKESGVLPGCEDMGEAAPRTAATSPVKVDLALPEPVSALAPVPESPITESMREIWLSASLSDDANCAFNESVSLRFNGPLEIELLRQALEATVARHDALRLTISSDGNTLHFAPLQHLDLSVVDLCGTSDTDAAITAVMNQEASTPFDLGKGPLFRTQLFTTATDRAVLLFTAHHIIMDGWSATQIFEDVGCIYSALRDGTTPDLAPVMPFSAYAARQPEVLAGERRAEIEKYWVNRFTGRAPKLDLPLDRPRPAFKTFPGSTVRHLISADTYRHFRSASAKQGCTLYATLLAGFELLLHRLTGSDEVVTGISAAGQTAFEEEAAVGHYVHFLPMLSQWSEGQTVADHIQQTRRVLLEAYDHQEFTFASLLQKISFPRDPSRLPLVEVQFNLERVGAGVRFSGLHSELEANPKRFVNTDLFLNIVESDKGLLLDCDYNTDLWDASTVTSWLGCFEQAVSGMLADPSQTVKQVKLFSEAEEATLDGWNRTDKPFDATVSVVELFEAIAGKRENNIAAVCDGERISYRELNEKANQLAFVLRRQGVDPDVMVGICMERSLRLLVSILAVWKAGGVCVPLDPQFPRERLRAIAEEIAGPVLLAEESVAGLWRDIPARVLCVDQEMKRLPEARKNVPLQAGRGESLAYVLFTSGSTGKPKGVQIEHRSLTNLLASMQRAPGISENDRLVAVTTISFDIAWLELFLPLVSGARVIIATQEQVRDPQLLQQLLQNSKTTMLQATPAGWRMLIESNWPGLPNLKMLCGGEALPRELADKLLPCGKELWNLYGPTETTIWSSASRVEHGTGPVPVGGPIDNTQFHVLDEQSNLVPLGVPGELYIGGAGLARGYLNRDELTRQRFVERKIAGRTRRLYRTGDLVRRTRREMLEFLGRLDHQVKVRGYRIELGDVESAVRTNPLVTDCVVVAHMGSGEENQLVAYIVPPAGADTQQLEADLRDILAAKLPIYMHPAAYVFLAAFPKTPNNKVDRNALPAPSFSTQQRRQNRIQPTTEDEVKLAQIWCDVLRLDEVGVNENIFELGGDSLGIFRIATLANQEGISVLPRHLFQHRTISGVLDRLKQPVEAAPTVSGFQVSARSRRPQNGKAD